ncbi:hypothetical protein [Oceanobacter antarcticus]|uniref:Uncharacterized protein n=1 Tax=Oceanobacter antarcticus TaxID=3133425 RepID=A0ABW8NIA6_9GAMM
MQLQANIWQRAYHWMLRRAKMERANLGLFVAGATFFFLGGSIIYAANLRLADSVGQELITLFGLLIAAGGAISATLGYIALSVFRLMRHSRKDDSNSF